jgi:hypothetical protein
VTALTREPSRHKLPKGCEAAIGNALDRHSYGHLLNGADTFVQLVGVAHPGPAKGRQFVEIDLKSGLEALTRMTTAHSGVKSWACPARTLYDFSAKRHVSRSATGEKAPDIDGQWEIEVDSPKGEHACRLLVNQSGSDVSAVRSHSLETGGWPRSV